MKNDPIYLFQELTRKASLGVLSVAGNFCEYILYLIFLYLLNNIYLTYVEKVYDKITVEEIKL